MTKTRLLHGTGHSSVDCRVLKEYSKKYATQQSHKESEAWSGGKINRVKSVKFDGNVKEVNIMEHDYYNPNKKKKKLAKNRKSESKKADPEELGRSYGIDRLNIGEAKHDSSDT